MSELMPPPSLNAINLGYFNYTLDNWVNRTATQLLTNVSTLPVFNIPPTASNLFLTSFFNITSTVAVTLSNLRFYVVWDNVPLVASPTPGSFWNSYGIALETGDVHVGPGSTTVGAYICVGESANSIAPKLVSDPTAQIPFAAFPYGNGAQQISTLRTNTYQNGLGANLEVVLPERVRFYFDMSSSIDFVASAGAVLDVQNTVTAITER
jgi:hypothetical protein